MDCDVFCFDRHPAHARAGVQRYRWTFKWRPVLPAICACAVHFFMRNMSSSGGSRHRAWCFTLHDYDESDEDRIQSVGCRYLVYGREVCPTTGREHLQGTIIYHHPQRFASVKAAIGGTAHIEACVDAAASAVYCKKDGNYFEAGLAPKPRATEVDWEAVRSYAVARQFDQIPYFIFIRHRTAILQSSLDFGPVPETLSILDNCWFWGPPGTGKSRTARENPPFYVKSINKWWDGYAGEQLVIMDELELDAQYMGHLLKIWGDRYPFNAEVKGGTMLIRPKRIIVTSNYSIDEVFKEPQMRAAVKRRFTEMFFPDLEPLPFVYPDA